jgi:hypothetical protein
MHGSSIHEEAAAAAAAAGEEEVVSDRSISSERASERASVFLGMPVADPSILPSFLCNLHACIYIYIVQENNQDGEISFTYL